MRILFSHDTIDTVCSSERGVTTFSSEAFALDIIALIKADNMSIYLTFPSRLEDFIFNDVKCEV